MFHETLVLLPCNNKPKTMTFHKSNNSKTVCNVVNVKDRVKDLMLKDWRENVIKNLSFEHMLPLRTT